MKKGNPFKSALLIFFRVGLSNPAANYFDINHYIDLLAQYH